MAGAGGDGVVSTGDSLISAVASEGYYSLVTKSFGPQIRGGESSCRVRISTRPVPSPGGALDVAIALNWEDFLKFGAELPVGTHTIVLYDTRTGVAPDQIPLGVTPAEVMAVPIGDMARDAGSEKAKNTVVLGFLAQWFGIAPDALRGGMRKKFRKKSEKVLEQNEKAFSAGIEYAKNNPLKLARPLRKVEAARKIVTDGNDMVAAAAIFAGCKFFGGYPITPSSEIMHFLARELWKYGGAVVQAEDEMAGIGTALGASYAGVKAMTATSGPGMSLKTEIIGLATISELPLVIVNVQRGGPATGIPTKSEQADLFQAAFSAHGDVMRPVLASTGVADTFPVVVEAFNLAEQFQTPVIVLTDQEISQRKEAVDPVDTSRYELVERLRPTAQDLEDYVRFRQTESGISPVSHPGMPGGSYLASGIEHNEHGDPTANGAIHHRMNEKRMRKFARIYERKDLIHIEGDEGAPIGVVSWGSSACVCREAVEMARADGLKVKLLVPHLLYPVLEDVYREFFASVTGGLVVEQSYQGQLYRILRMFVDVPQGVQPYARSGANPFLPGEIVTQIRELAGVLKKRRETGARASEQWGQL